MLVSIILLNYKKPDLTLSCVESLFEQMDKEVREKDIEIIIVDNASNDGSVEQIKKEIEKEGYVGVTLIENNLNAGFAKGCNLGAEKAKGKFILFLNNDTIVKDRGILDMARHLEENKDAAILGGQLKNPDGSKQPSAGSFYTLANAFMLLVGMQKLGLLDKSPNKITKVDWVKGGLLMIRKEVFENLRGFDENIFMYTEDMELCYRAKKEGLNTYFFPFVEVLHKEYGSTNRTFAIVNIYKNLLYFYKKHRSYPEYLILKSMLITKAILLSFFGALSGNSYLKSTYKEALNSVK
jgi:GT2 family glycosyltransferase